MTLKYKSVYYLKPSGWHSNTLVLPFRSTLCSVMAQLTEDIQPSFETTLKSKAVSENCNVKFTCVVSGRFSVCACHYFLFAGVTEGFQFVMWRQDVTNLRTKERFHFKTTKLTIAFFVNLSLNITGNIQALSSISSAGRLLGIVFCL